MKSYIVLYRDSMQEILPFACQADDFDHAEEQTLNAFPDSEIVLVHQGNSVSFRGVKYTTTLKQSGI